MEAEFFGLTPWGFGSEIIECDGTSLGNIDLHNDCNVTALLVRLGAETAALQISFQVIESRAMFNLIFEDVSRLEIAGKESYPGDGQVFHALDYYGLDLESAPQFELEFESLTAKFRASKVSFQH